MGTRIKGQDTAIQVVVDGKTLIDVGSPIRNFELTPKFTKLEEQYLGGTTKRYDEIFDGVDFKFDMHFENDNVIKLVETIRSRAIGQQLSTNAKINIATTLYFSGGKTKRVFLSDCFFENLPIEFGDRSSYGQFTVSGSCSDFSIIA